MGSFKNKINNKKKKKMEAEALNELIGLKKKMKEQFSAEEYVEAMDTMAEIARHKKMDPEIMLMGATCYFMTGDYERSATWINNTLTYDPQNVGARILLGRICIVQDDWEQGLKVLNFVAENQQAAMSDKNREDFKQILEYCNLNMKDEFAKLPALVTYFKEHCRKNEVAVSQEQPITHKASEDDGKGKDKAKAAVDRLKALLNKSRGQKTVQEQTKVSTTMAEPVPAKTASTTKTTESDNNIATKFMDKVMSSNISLREKVQSLNNYASGLYLNDDYAGALLLLKKALEMDSGDSFVLRNIAYVCVAMTDRAQALEFAKALPMVDFGLLKAIKEL